VKAIGGMGFDGILENASRRGTYAEEPENRRYFDDETCTLLQEENHWQPVGGQAPVLFVWIT
jgi:hypothetical protein